MENINVANDTQQTVVESANGTACNNGGAKTGTPVISAEAESAVRTQSRAENSGFRKLRLENEGYKKEIESLKKQLGAKQSDIYLEKLIADKMSADLERIRELDPKVQSLSSLGEEFIRLIECGIDAKTAYRATAKATDGKELPVPPGTKAMGTTFGSAPAYFTSRQLDRLSAKDLEDPRIFKKAMESLKRL